MAVTNHAASDRERDAASYSYTNLYTLTPPSGFTAVFPSQQPEDIASGQAVGEASSTSTYHAMVFNGGVVTDVNPAAFLKSEALGTNGINQVGYGFLTSTGVSHALLWSGSAASAVDLNPTSGFNGTFAYGTGGIQQVGNGTNSSSGSMNALLWSGSAASVVNLQPTTGFGSSAAFGTDGVQQAGYGYITSGPTHALLWSGTAASVVDLNPVSGAGSVAYYTFGGQQVGVLANGSSHAMVWNGTAASAVDLNPTNLTGFTTSYAYGTNGIQQVGTGSGIATGGDSHQHALLWSDTSNSAIDLGALLPSSIVSSEAYSIDATGNVFGIATDSSGVYYATEWSAVPEPSATVMLAIAAVAFLCSHAGIQPNVIDNQAAYLAGWLKQIKADKKLIISAAGQAQRATDWIRGERGAVI